VVLVTLWCAGTETRFAPGWRLATREPDCGTCDEPVSADRGAPVARRSVAPSALDHGDPTSRRWVTNAGGPATAFSADVAAPDGTGTSSRRRRGTGIATMMTRKETQNRCSSVRNSSEYRKSCKIEGVLKTLATRFEIANQRYRFPRGAALNGWLPEPDLSSSFRSCGFRKLNGLMGRRPCLQSENFAFGVCWIVKERPMACRQPCGLGSGQNRSIGARGARRCRAIEENGPFGICDGHVKI
jgi:hypothetical protein